MSLIMAQKFRGFQLWSCDGLVVVDERDQTYVLASAIDKIYQMVPNAVAIGFSGNCYDAAEMLHLATYHRHIASIEYLAEDLAHIVVHVNLSSARMRQRRGLPRVKTGLIVGGFLDSTSFLFLVAPDGRTISAPAYAAMGAGLSPLAASAIRSLPSCTLLDDSIAKHKEVFDLATEAQATDGVRQTVVITPTGVTGCSAIGSARTALTSLDLANHAAPGGRRLASCSLARRAPSPDAWPASGPGRGRG